MITPLKNTFFYFIKRRNHPRFAKYFNKLELGSCTEEEVRKLMVKDGVEPSVGDWIQIDAQVLELDQHEWIALEQLIVCLNPFYRIVDIEE